MVDATDKPELLLVLRLATLFEFHSSHHLRGNFGLRSRQICAVLEATSAWSIGASPRAAREGSTPILHTKSMMAGSPSWRPPAVAAQRPSIMSAPAP